MALIHKANQYEACQFKLDWRDPLSAFLVLDVNTDKATSLRFLPASVYLSPTFSSSSFGLGGGHTACRRPGVRSSLSVGDVTSVCGEIINMQTCQHVSWLCNDSAPICVIIVFHLCTKHMCNLYVFSYISLRGTFDFHAGGFGDSLKNRPQIFLVILDFLFHCLQIHIFCFFLLDTFGAKDALEGFVGQI